MTDAELTIVTWVWTVGLIVALVLTAMDVVLLLRVIRAAQKIKRLASRTLPAAEGIARHTAAIRQLSTTNDVARQLVDGAMPIAQAAQGIENKLGALSRFLIRQGAR
jgi:hypothetical protein